MAALVELFRPRGILERNDPRVRALEGLPAAGRRAPRRGAGDGRPSAKTACASKPTSGAARRRGSSWTSARTTPWPATTRAGASSTASPTTAASASQVAAQADEVLAVDVSAEAVARVAAQRRPQRGHQRDRARGQRLRPPARPRRAAASASTPSSSIRPPSPRARRRWRRRAAATRRSTCARLKLLRPGGCLITCSCSYHVHEADLEGILADAAADAGATVSVVEKRRQARDHPILLGVPETYYLKCFVLRKLA